MPDNKPAEIQNALNVLARLDSSDQDSHQALRKALPILAVKLKQHDYDFSEAALEAYVAEGITRIADEVKALSSAPTQHLTALSYDDIKEGLRSQNEEELDDFLSSPEGVFYQLCMGGDLDEIKAHVNAGLDFSECGPALLQGLIDTRRADVIIFLYDLELDLGEIVVADILNLAAIGCEDIVKDFIHQHSSNFDFMVELYDLAAYNNYVAVMQLMHETAIATDFDHGQAALNAAQGNGVDSLQFLHQELGVDISAHDHAALTLAAGHSAIDTMEYLRQHGESFDDLSDDNLAYIFEICDLEVLTHMVQGTAVFTRSGQAFTDIRAQLASLGEWKTIHSEAKMGGLPRYAHRYNPLYYHHDMVVDLVEILKKEGVDDALNCAYGASALFGGNDAQLMRYLDKWAEDGTHPLYTATYMISIPRSGTLNMKAWGDAVMQHGPKMAELVQFADVLDTPKRSKCGRSWSVNATRAAAAEYVYEGGTQYPEFAKLCLDVGWASELFDTGTMLIGKYEEAYGSINAAKAGGGLPEINIDGALFDKPRFNFRKLKDGDLRGLALGELTDCCQHLGDAGAACTAHGFLSTAGGFYVLADKKTDEIVAQSWAWRGQKDEIVFDSLEYLGEHMSTEKWSTLLDNLGAAFQKHAGVSAFLVGTEGDTPQDLPYPIACQGSIAEPIDYQGYRDSKDGQYVVYKR
jgi:hypothetical protein